MIDDPAIGLKGTAVGMGAHLVAGAFEIAAVATIAVVSITGVLGS